MNTREYDSAAFMDQEYRPQGGLRGLRIKLYEKLYYWLQERVPRREPRGDRAYVDLHWVDGGFVQQGAIFGNRQGTIRFEGLTPKRTPKVIN